MRKDVRQADIAEALGISIVSVSKALAGKSGVGPDLRKKILEKAEENLDAVMPAYTHGQNAQPMTFAHYLLSIQCKLDRDFDRMR